MTPLKRVRLEHGDERERIQSLTLPSAAPVFATQPLRSTNDSWRVDETYIEVKGKPKYLYRAVDSAGNTIDFLLTAKRDALLSKTFFP